MMCFSVTHNRHADKHTFSDFQTLTSLSNHSSQSFYQCPQGRKNGHLDVLIIIFSLSLKFEGHQQIVQGPQGNAGSNVTLLMAFSSIDFLYKKERQKKKKHDILV